MNVGARKSAGRGFSVVEVMIFLAISGLMLVSAISLFSGTQARTQFSQSMRDAESKFQDIINDVSTGYFDEVQGYKCLASASGPYFVVDPSTSQGKNQQCIFIGKAVQVLPASGSTFIEFVPVYGNRVRISDGKDVSSFSEAEPVTGYYTTPISIDATSQYELKWGSHVKNVVSPSNSYLGGVYGSFSKYAASGSSSSVKSGAQQVSLLNHLVAANASKDSVKTCVRSKSACYLASPQPWVICFERSDGQETAQLTVDNATLTTKLEFIDC